MPDPILVEERFQTLVEELEPVESIRQRISLIREFLLFLEGNYGKFDSYIVEITHYWPLYSGPITYSGIDPSEILDDLSLFEEIGALSGTVVQQEVFSEITARLREVAAVLFLCLGNVQSAFSIIGHSAKKEPGNPAEASIDRLSVANTDSIHVNTFEQFRRVILSERTQELSNDLAVNVGRIVKDLNYICDKKNQNDILVPVVESFDAISGNRQIYGRLRRLLVRVNSKNDLQTDRIVRRYSVLGVEKPGWLEDSRVSLAARELLTQFSPDTEFDHFNGEMFYEYSGPMHQGSSSNAATAALWFTGLQKKEELRERYQLNNNIALTGDVDEEGHLLPVSENSIKAKVHASFFSWASALIVPLPQADAFREELRTLQKKYPNKELTLLSPNRLDELFFDRRISTHLNPSKMRHAASRIWAKKFETAGLLVIAVLSLIVFRLAYGPLDKNPVLYEFSGEVLLIKNSVGSILETIEVGERTVERLNAPYRIEYVVFEDLTGDGINEIIWAELTPMNSAEAIHKIKSKELNSDELLWEKSLKYDLDYPQKPYVEDTEYIPQIIKSGDFTGDGIPNLLISIEHSPFFPGILSLRNAITGEEISHIVNPGHILDFEILDHNENTGSTIVFCGVSNAYNQGFVAILDLNYLFGVTPSNEEYELKDYELIENISYVLIPRTIVSQNIVQHNLRTQAERVQVNNEGEIIRAYVRDFSQYQGSQLDLPVTVAYLEIFFNKDLTVRGIGTSDAFDVVADQLFKTGVIERKTDFQYFNEYQNEFLYWDGEEFVTRSGD